MQSRQPGRVDLFGREISEPETPAAPATSEPGTEASSSLSSGFNLLGDRRVSLIVPAASYHFNHQGRHQPGYNETRNFGMGIAVQTSKNTEAFVVAYRNSYADRPKYKDDVTVMAGVNWDPLKVDMGPLHLKAGLMAGVATTLKGSYADMAPQVSRGNFTLMGGFHAEAVHRESGIGVGATVLPATRNTTGVASFYLKKQF